MMLLEGDAMDQKNSNIFWELYLNEDFDSLKDAGFYDEFCFYPQICPFCFSEKFTEEILYGSTDEYGEYIQSVTCSNCKLICAKFRCFEV